jgi:hypothetical protein
MSKAVGERVETSNPTIQRVYNHFIEAYEVIENASPFLVDSDGIQISPRVYWENGRRRFNAIADLPPYENTQDWMSRYNKALARNKSLGLIAHIVAQNMSGSIIAQNSEQIEDKAAAMFLKDSVDNSFDKEKFDVKKFWGLVTSVAEGTVIWEENYGEFKQWVKEVTEIDYETGKTKYVEKEVDTWKGAYVEIVPNDQYLVPNPYLRTPEDQDYIIRYYKYTYDQAQKYFGHYELWDQVVPGMSVQWAEETDIFKQFDQFTQLQSNEVLVIKHFVPATDTLDIVANGVQLTEEGNPIPRPITNKGKRLPFTIQFIEPIDNDYYLGKSWSDRLGREEDSINLAYRMFNDREFLNTFQPVQTDDDALLNEDVIQPGNVISKTPGTEGASPILAPAVTTGLVNLIQMLEGNADDASLSQLAMGQDPGAGQMTATQTLQMAKSAQTMLNTFNELQRHAIANITELRIETLLWRMKTEDLDKITVHDRMLKTGKRGSRTYFFEKGFSKLKETDKQEYSSKLKGLEDRMGGKMEAVILDPDELLEHLDWYVVVDADPKPRRTDDLMKILAMDKYNFYKQNMDDFNTKGAAEDLALIFGDDPDEVVRPAEEQQQMPQAPGSSSPPGSPAPQGQSQSPGQLRTSLKQAMGQPK